MDARHHPFDVISGSALGIVVAWGAYRQYFPPVSESWHKGRAYPIRAWGTEPKTPNQNPLAMPRGQSPVELSHVRRQPGWDDPENGHREAGVPIQSTNMRAQPQSSFPASQNYSDPFGDDSRENPSETRNEAFDGNPGQRQQTTSSSSSIELERWRPSPFDPSMELPRGRTQARGIRGGHDTFSSSTLSLQSHDVEGIGYANMAPPPLSPSKSPQRHGNGFGADTAYHPPTNQSPVAHAAN